MPLWFPVIAAGAAMALVGKAITRHLNGQLASSAVHDPDGVRTVARFTVTGGSTETVLHAVAAELGKTIDELEVRGDAVRSQAIDIVRLTACGAATYSLMLTRAWTGPQLHGDAYDLLGQIHQALASYEAIAGLTWYARQDRELVRAFRHPWFPDP
jgi:membrane protein required for beta-lactamase induction